ncbi:HPr family phosphocarrier protein [Ammoniphilus sp. 3BR4]|uniref:HPr family phosphocarrier protein n=1 Tax=Ammoniphilus sp. 3BR4 TaxID=3158265 RepID=UPI003465791D
MILKTIVIQNRAGLHVRPASLFVQKAISFSGAVNVIKGTKRVDGKSIMGVMSLAASKGEEITLEIEGEVDGELEIKLLQELGAILTTVHD